MRMARVWGVATAVGVAVCGVHVNRGEAATAGPPVLAAPSPLPPMRVGNNLIHAAPTTISGPLRRPPTPARPAGVATSALATGPDLNALRQLRLRAPKHCGPMEVAPGQWVFVDCNRYSPVTKARVLTRLPKVKLLKKGALKVSSAFRTRLRKTNGANAGTSGGAGGGTSAGGGAGPLVGEEYELPEKVDHREDGIEGPVKFQGSVGSCTAFSLSSAMDNAIRRLERGDTTSAQHIWAHYGYPNMSVAGDANFLRPIANQEVWPYNEAQACKIYKGPSQFSCGPTYRVQQDTADSDPVIQAKLREAGASGKYKIVQIDRLPLDPDDIAGILASGADIWAAFGISMDAWRTSALSRDYVIPDWTMTDGGHAVVIAGYRTTPRGRQFLIHNSWGEQWGDRGYAWITERSLKANLYDAYKIKIEPVGGAPPARLTDDDCAEDELVDAVLNQCGKICPDDTRPSNGACR